jgi:hypothetical protein
MAFNFDPAVGTPTSNSYGDVTEADDYFGGRLNATAWPATSVGADLLLKQQALATASSRIDQEQYEDDEKADPAQRMKFPRAVDVDVIPDIVKFATFEEALFLLRAGTSDPTGTTGLEQFKGIKVGPVELTMYDRSPNPDGSPNAGASDLAPAAQRWLRPILVSFDVEEPTFERVKLIRS